MALLALTILNIAATALYLIRRRGFGFPVMAATQSANLVAVIVLVNAEITGLV